MYIQVIRLFSAKDLHGPPLYQPQKYFKFEILEAFPYSTSPRHSSLILIKSLDMQYIPVYKKPFITSPCLEGNKPISKDGSRNYCRCFLTAPCCGGCANSLNESVVHSSNNLRKNIFRLQLGRFLALQKF